jgi:hypothetical protein
MSVETLGEAFSAGFEAVNPRRPESWVSLTKLVQSSDDDKGTNFRKATDEEFATAPKSMIIQSGASPCVAHGGRATA